MCYPYNEDPCPLYASVHNNTITIMRSSVLHAYMSVIGKYLQNRCLSFGPFVINKTIFLAVIFHHHACTSLFNHYNIVLHSIHQHVINKLIKIEELHDMFRYFVLINQLEEIVMANQNPYSCQIL